MKKVYSLMVAALMSFTMLAGQNDLLWDFTEVAPGSSPVAADNNPNVKLTYDSKVNDAAGTKNGLKGIKMNGSGYCYFTKAAVAGKLKLSYGPRDGSNKSSLEVFTWAGETPAAETSLGVLGEATELQTFVIDLTEAQNNIYIKRKLSVETVLTKIEFTENVARSFVDFKIEFRDNPYTVLLPEGGELPAGVKVENTSYNGGQHGIFGGVITVPVDGAVKFTIGACQYSGTPIVIKKDGEKLLDFSNNAACGETAGNFAQNVTYTYTGGAGTLTFELAGNTYVPYFFAEAVEVTPCTVTFKDQNGGVLGTVETIEGATLEAIPYTEADLPTIAETDKFRGWFYTSGKKAQAGDLINGNTTIQAKVTPIETVTVGSVQTYDFASAIFYPEDHETVEVNGGAFHDGTHGWYFAADGSINVQVAGKAVVVVPLCQYSETGDVMVMAGDQELAKASVVKNETADGTELTAKYEGEATTLTINWTAKQYIHKVVVYNVEGFAQKDETTGYIMVPSGDAASLILALVQAEEGDKLFVPNGTYDLGETVLTTISKNNIAVIGQSMEKTIIKNAPDAKTESIDKTATLRIAKNVSGTYLQDLTIQNALDYYKNNNGRAVALWDQGTKTVCKNVRLLSYQDTYYSNLPGAVKYLEDCEIHGTVDYICGDGSVYFYGTELVCEQRSTEGGGSDAITASNAAANDKGYVFDHCTVKYAENIEGTKPVVSFGRSWNNSPKTIFLYTFLDNSNGELNMYKDASAQKDKISRWTLGAMNALPELFGEYYSVNSDGANVTPESNNVTFVLNSTEKTMETVLTADQAAAYTMEYTLGDWAATAKADATQAVCEKEWTELEADAIYMAECEGMFVMLLKGSEISQLMVYDGKTYTLRKANARGGFGKVTENEDTGVEDVSYQQSAVSVQKVMRDGQLIIIRDGIRYNTIGQTIR